MAWACRSPAPSSRGLVVRMFEQGTAQRPTLDAIFFCNDDRAQGATLAAAGLRIAVSGRVALAGFNDLVGSEQMLPAASCVDHRMHASR